MKFLKVVLWICGIGFMLSFIVMILPWSAIESLYGFFGEGALPGTPVSGYVIRVMCAIVGLIGIYFLMLARDPVRYRPLLFFTSLGLIACGLLCFFIGLIVGISPLFYIGDGLFGIISGLIIAGVTAQVPKS
jgi:hypothetical protein